ncbi:MAG TPA: hypothetical protein VHV77_15850, partial [Pirellulales bacterium]|nr:hypothetical protein [Pirellulales bacterium]
MKPKIILASFGLVLAAGALVLTAQQANFNIEIFGGQDQLKLAVPDFQGSGDAAKLMEVFNTTLWNEIDGGGVVKLVGKSLYPLTVPQTPADLVPPGRAKLGDWSAPPVSANDLAFGYAAAQNGQFLVLGNLDNLSQANPAQASLFANRYSGSLDENGARDVARRYAADILAQFGGKSLSGTKIYFVSDRSVAATKQADGVIIGVKEIWSMDYDGSNQRQLTFYKSPSQTPAISADGKMLAFTTYPQKMVNGHLMDDNPRIMIQSVETNRALS